MKRPRKNKKNPVAKELRTPRYKPQVIPNKKNKLPRKGKHKNLSEI